MAMLWTPPENLRACGHGRHPKLVRLLPRGHERPDKRSTSGCIRHGRAAQIGNTAKVRPCARAQSDNRCHDGSGYGWASPCGVALPHFWWKGISPRAVIPLEANAVLGSPASCCQFAIGAARKIDKGAALQDVAAPRWP